MISSLLRFLFDLFILLALMIPVNYYILEELINLEFSILHYVCYAYFTLMVFLIHIFMLRSLELKPQRFVIYFMASMGVKIFLSLLVLVVIMYTGINNSKVFVINYLSLYFVYSFFSVYHTLRAQKRTLPKL